DGLAEAVVPGRRVLVPFGKGNGLRQGFVFFVEKATKEDGSSELKAIAEVLDDQPLLSEEMVKLALFIKERVFCTYFSAAKAMLPGGMCSKNAPNELCVKMVRLSEAAKTGEPVLTSKQRNIYDILAQFQTASVKELTYYTGCTPAVIKTMEKNGVCEIYELPVSRSPVRDLSPGGSLPPVLSQQQADAFEKLYAAYMSGKSETALLFGVTGSGKTNVYLALIDKILSDGKNVIVLVPEISLTSQTIALFERRFGKSVAVLHSGLSAGERRDEFFRIKNKNARVVIGTRSAVFAPLENIGAIIIDEEQEHTYKSEMSPRYDARVAARFRCAFNNAVLVLASATPSVETYAKALEGKYLLCELTERYGSAVLPEVITVDMTDKRNIDRYSAICNPLADEIELNLKNNKQSILLVNRRGYNTFVVCEECKNVVTCPKCSISLTYHSANNRLMCHYCGYSEEFTDVCPKCSHKNIRYSGFGTQRVEQELHSRFKDARILRMDADTTGAKNAHEKALSAFAAGEYDILIGTQMVAKGLDFPNVTLVGIISADNELYTDDFRSAEKTFDLITQVTGR
ncbi:MAG: primosomal protein N', partial [Clostridia bacterium]|nr:primosomal protein N' [Clostridia bacterium]